MITIKITNPTEAGVYPPGQMGTVSADITKSGIVIPWGGQVRMFDAQGIVIWEGAASISGDKIGVNLNWPTEDGQYTVEVQCLNPMGTVLASDRQVFHVRRASPNPATLPEV